jgi:hypothetical protein
VILRAEPIAHCDLKCHAGQYSVDAFGPEIEKTPYTFTDERKINLRVVSVLVWSVSAFLLYKGVVETPIDVRVWWITIAIFVLCSGSVVYEFMYRPRRVTTIRLQERQVVIQETAPWRSKSLVASIPPGMHFEVFQCDSDNTVAHGVRIRSSEKRWITVAEYVSREKAELLAREANLRLMGSAFRTCDGNSSARK